MLDSGHNARDRVGTARSGGPGADQSGAARADRGAGGAIGGVEESDRSEVGRRSGAERRSTEEPGRENGGHLLARRPARSEVRRQPGYVLRVQLQSAGWASQPP